MKKKLLLLSTIVLMSTTSFGQNYRSTIDQYLTQNNLIPKSNSIDYQIVENIPNQKNNTERVFIQYEHNGIPIHNAYGNFTFKNNQVAYFAGSKEINLNKSFPQSKSSLSDDALLNKIGGHFGLATKKTTKNNANIENGVFLVETFEVKPYYFLDANDNYRLVKEFMVQVKSEKDNDIHMVLVDVTSGEILHEHASSLSCDFHPETFSNPEITENKQDWDWLYNELSLADQSNPSYKVYPFPIEAPNFGNAETVNYTDISNSTASPEGWHKYGTQAVASTTYGNNVRAAHDHTSVGFNSFTGLNVTLDGMVEAPDYNFDFDFNLESNPFNSKEAATTNLFYVSNMMHDVLYNYGFDEASGNFQKNNFGKGGSQNDEVIALAQTRFNEGVLNNAQFGTLPDGYMPRMSMYLWDAPTNFVEKVVVVNSPSSLAGSYESRSAAFNPVDYTEVTANYVLGKKSDTTTGDIYDGCSPLSNATELQNNIAILKRGSCDFVVKVKNAQNAGAKAVVMMNNIAGAPSTMGGTDATITIPSAMITQDLGNSFIALLEAGTTVSGKYTVTDVPYFDGSLDNGIIAHEYGHGVSNRLTGPLSTANCLLNTEQMGEGWSDYLGLMLTMHPEDTREKARGIGTFVINQASTGAGIRPTRYSTNTSVNPSTYNTLKNYTNAESPHRTGYVWATMLWEMTWNLIDKYGFSPDMYNGTAGNNLALQLVMDGMKGQPCSPGFVDGRDAILAADQINNDGENQCEIWTAFAKRGLGYGADQGSSNSRTDGTASFEMPPADVLDCSELSVNDSKVSSLQMFPNPVKDKVYFTDSKLDKNFEVEIIDVTGRLVSTKALKVEGNRTSLDTSTLTPGVYIIKIKNGQETVTKKLIKN